MPKKYQLVLPERNPERMHKPLKDVLKPFDFEKCKPSRLPEELQTFMKMLVSILYTYGLKSRSFPSVFLIQDSSFGKSLKILKNENKFPGIWKGF